MNLVTKLVAVHFDLTGQGPAERLALALPSLGRRDIATQMYIREFKDIYHFLGQRTT